MPALGLAIQPSPSRHLEHARNLKFPACEVLQMPSLSSGLAGVLLVALATTPAMAGPTICNKTPYRLSVATVWFYNARSGVSTGGEVNSWHQVNAGDCSLVARQVAHDGPFYYYAHTVPNSAHEWATASRLCVKAKAFTTTDFFLIGDQGRAPGWRPQGFRHASLASSVEQKVDIIRID